MVRITTCEVSSFWGGGQFSAPGQKLLIIRPEELRAVVTTSHLMTHRMGKITLSKLATLCSEESPGSELPQI